MNLAGSEEFRQGLKPTFSEPFTARLKPCPLKKHFEMTFSEQRFLL
jgi:hypothetical protein